MTPSEKFFKYLAEGRNIFLTGAGGTGKSYLIRQALEMYPHNFVVTSTTGISAMNLMEGAMTIHSFSGLGIRSLKDFPSEREIQYFLKSLEHSYDDISGRVLYCNRLVIDEISMLSADQLDLVDRIFRHIRKSDFAFGGCQVVLSGDALQLPPVGKRGEDGKEIKERMFFESDVWKSGNFVTVHLTEVKRTNNKDFALLLHRIRDMSFTAKDFKKLKSTEERELTVNPVKLYNSNMKVDTENEFQLSKIEGNPVVFKAKYRGDFEKVKELRNSILAVHELKLKVGCRVMIIINQPSTDSLNDVPYVNGSTGTYLGLRERQTSRQVWHYERDPITLEPMKAHKDFKRYHVLHIRLDNGSEVFLKKHTWKLGDERENQFGIMQAEAEYSQFPVRLAYAMTIHKSQGLSLDHVEIDAHGIRTDNQFYVAVSRATSFEGLKIKNLKGFHIRACPKALEFYNSEEFRGE